jgi:hypothetical protein
MSHARPLLAIRRSVPAPAPVERLAWAVLAVLACTLAHETVYQLLYPGAYRAAMTLTGHDGYWAALSVGVVLATSWLIGVAAWQLRRLHREAVTTPALAADEGPGIASYLRLVAATWVRLAMLAGLAFTFQENLEAIAAGRPVRGMDVILGHALVPLLVVLAATLLMSFVVALVRWRRRVLLGRLATIDQPWSRMRARRARSLRDTLAFGRHPGATWASRAPPQGSPSLAL